MSELIRNIYDIVFVHLNTCSLDSFFDKVSGINNIIKKLQELQDMAFEFTKILWLTILTI